MYSTRWTCPIAVRLCRSNLALRTGQIFFTIWEKLSKEKENGSITYFVCGQVVELEMDGQVVRAEVSGTQEYHIEIRKVGGRVVQMECDRPWHAYDGITMEKCRSIDYN